jgi:1-aminocyclopropane-1-carboxylate deaminase/D-cysteine desulfhydrase-like pyridoxal-dependent ACC family enzyme
MIVEAVSRSASAGSSAIREEIDVDQRFIGEDYAVPSADGVAAIRELAQTEGLFVGPVYTAKGLAGILSDMVRSGPNGLVSSELVELAELRASARAGLSSARGDDPGS